MSKLCDEITATLLPCMAVPESLRQLFDWIEQHGYFVDTDDRRVGSLFPDDELKAGWTDDERPGGTIIEFSAEGNAELHYWFGHERRDVLDRLCVFAHTGAEGSMAAFWLDDGGKQRIVHLGSGSGAVMCCVLADDPIDFLRLLAIGYDEICWNDAFSESPNADDELFVHPNIAYQNWVQETFGVTIPKTALEIVRNPAEMGDEDSLDAFCRWVEQNSA